MQEGKETRESEPNYEEIVQALCEFHLSSHDRGDAHNVLGHDFFEEKGFQNMYATYDRQGSEKQLLGVTKIVVKPRSFEPWTIGVRKTAIEQIQRIISGIHNRIDIVADYGPETSEEDFDDPFAR